MTTPQPVGGRGSGTTARGNGAAGAPDAPGPADGEPLGSLPRRVSGRAPDGRSWELSATRAGVTVVMAAATVADVRIWESDGLVAVQFWADGTDLPDGLGVQLVGQAFAHPSVRAGRAILACVSRRHGVLLQQVSRRIDGARTRAAGMTCLIEGTVAGDRAPLDLRVPG